MKKLFAPKVKDRAIETTCSNLIMAEVLLPGEVANYMVTIASYPESKLAEILCYSRLLLDNYLKHCWNLN